MKTCHISMSCYRTCVFSETDAASYTTAIGHAKNVAHNNKMAIFYTIFFTFLRPSLLFKEQR